MRENEALIESVKRLVSGICERLTVLNFGQILAEGETEQVLQNPEVIKAYGLGKEVVFALRDVLAAEQCV